MTDAIIPPPPIPKSPASRPDPYAKFSEQYGPTGDRLTLVRVTDALLKRPGQLVHAIMHEDLIRTGLALFAILFVCMTAYGFLVGAFSGGPQLWVAPLKVWLGGLFSALLCLPSLYIFACLSGGRLSLPQVAALLLQSLALGSLLLVGFAPILWIFSQSTSAAGFMGFLHLLFWLVSIYFALRLLIGAMEFLNRESLPILKVWACIFILVVFQMCTFLRPLVGPFDGFRLADKQFFLSHWSDTLNGR
jgi:hypothetical protein